MAELLVELLSEEIPTGLQASSATELKRLVERKLNDAGLDFLSSQEFSTPRRLTLHIVGLPVRLPAFEEDRKGPKLGSSKKSIEGFAKSVGAVSAELEERDTGKGVYYFAKIRRKGGNTIELLPAILSESVAGISWPKSMRWGEHTERWIRPLHSMLCLFDGQVVPFTFGHLTAGAVTRGHVVHVPHAFKVSNFSEYEAYLREAKVILNPTERRKIIMTNAMELASSEGLSYLENERLVDELVGLAEWPVVMIGRIDEIYLDLPQEVLTAVMRTHQRYISLHKSDGTLAPNFIMVANTDAEDEGKAIVVGNERVLRARLADAKFFWEQDKKLTLGSRVPRLGHIIFHTKLGTLEDKIKRIQMLAARIVDYVPGADSEQVRLAANLAKADLTTQMVIELPELQGIMGSYYAMNDNESSEVARAIREHYAPRGPNDTCPSAPISIVIALADKIDSLFWFFAIHERPTGSKDPFALRRAVLGVIRLILENDLRIPLRKIFETAYSIKPDDGGIIREDLAQEEVGEGLLAFITDRLKVHLRGEGVRHDLISAAFAITGEDDLVRLLARVEALEEFLSTDDGANLLIAYKRASNIVRIEEKNDGRSYQDSPSMGNFREQHEKHLYNSLTDVVETSSRAIGEEKFVSAMKELAQLRRPIDQFFDEVTVNCDEPALRSNRLRLLSQIRTTLDSVADFSKIEGRE